MPVFSAAALRWKAAAVLGGTAAFGSLLYLDTSNKTLGVKRNLKFWVRAFPMYLHYRVTEELVKGKTDEEAAAAYNALHDRLRPTGRGSVPRHGRLLLQIRAAGVDAG